MEPPAGREVELPALRSEELNLAAAPIGMFDRHGYPEILAALRADGEVWLPRGAALVVGRVAVGAAERVI
jgi:hypothetical protein